MSEILLTDQSSNTSTPSAGKQSIYTKTDGTVVHQTDAGTVKILLDHKNNVSAIVAPVVTDDSSAGYEVGSVWIDTVLDTAYTCVDDTVGSAVWFSGSGGGGAVSASSVSIATGVGTPTVDQMQELIDSTGSSGYFEGGAITTGVGDTLDVALGSGFIRTTADPLAPLLSFKWSASAGIALTDDSANYVFVDSAGVVTVNVSEFIEAENKILLGVIIKEGGVVVSSFNFGVRLEESIAQAGRFLRRTLSISRDVRRGGLALGEVGTRNITLSSGTLWWGRTEYPIVALNTSVSGTFDAFYQDGVGGTTIESARTTWNNTQYDDGSGTLATLANNKWAVQWFFLEPDEHLSMVYGTTSNSSMANAELEKVPTVLPPRISEASILVGRLIFKKSAGTATIESAFDTTFVAGGASGFSDPMTTIGDMIVRDATNVTNRLAVGTVGQVLQSDGTNIAWGTAAGGGDMLADGTVAFTGLPVGIDPFQNLLINALGTVNQRGFSTGTLVGINGYTLDRWRTPANEAFNFVESLNKVIYTPPASGIEQVIEGKNIQSQTYTVSWVQETGTTTCTVGGIARTNGESFTLVGGTDTTVNFIGGTFSLPQVTLGTLVKPFDHRDYASELAKCQRYFERLNYLANTYALTGQATSTTTVRYPFLWNVSKRAAPTSITIPTADFNPVTSTGGVVTGTLLNTTAKISVDGCRLHSSFTSGVTAGNASYLVVFNDSHIDIDAEL